MSENATPFGDLTGDTFAGLGTAPASVSRLSEINLDLDDDIPVAYRPDEIEREATRYVVFAGDLMDKRKKRERPEFLLGGEHYGPHFKTLVRSRYTVRRCQITPLEIGYDFLNEEILGDNPNNLQVATALAQSAPDVVPGVPPGMFLGRRLTLTPVSMFPGDQIKSILIGERNQDAAKGVLEIKKLARIDYADFAKSGIQQFIFPNWERIINGLDSLPIKMSELDTHLRSRLADTHDPDMRDIVTTFLASSEQFREWGIRYLKYSATLVKMQFPSTGHVHTYSDLAEQLFDMLEVRREDMISTDRDIADIVARAQNGQTTGSDVTALLERMTTLMELVSAQKGTPAEQAAADVQAARCTAISTTTGQQCERDAIEGTDRCAHPAHRRAGAGDNGGA